MGTSKKKEAATSARWYATHYLSQISITQLVV